EVKPDFVLALGKTLWEKGFSRHELAGDIVTLGSETRPYCVHSHSEGSAFIFGITHPAYPRGWTYTEWSPWVKVAMEKARQLSFTITSATDRADQNRLMLMEPEDKNRIRVGRSLEELTTPRPFG